MEQLGAESSNVADPVLGHAAPSPQAVAEPHGAAEPSKGADGQAEKANRAREANLEASKKLDLEKDPTTSKKEQVPDPVVLKGNNSNHNDLVSTNPSCLPFPSRFLKSKKAKEDEEVLEIFRKVQVNIPLIDCLKQIPRYAKFFKELARKGGTQGKLRFYQELWTHSN